MNSSQIFIIISIAALVLVVILFLAARKKGKKLTPLVGLAWVLVLAGIVFSEDRLIGYSLMGVGVALAVIDMYITPKRTAWSCSATEKMKRKKNHGYYLATRINRQNLNR